MSKQNGLTALAARVAELEEQLTVIQRVPMIAYRLSEHRAWQAQRDRDRAEQQRAVDAYMSAEPQRRERFKAFAADRLTFGPAARTIDGLGYKVYIAWADERGLSKVERFTLEDFADAMLTQSGVKRGTVRSYVGGKVDGLLGVAVIEEYRHERDAHQDEDLERRLTRDEMIAGMTDEQRAARIRDHEVLAGAPGC